MPRPRAAKITTLTPELLTETWENENACRMWLRRRRQTALGLGCRMVETPDGVKLELLEDRPAPPADTVVVAPPASFLADPVNTDEFEGFAEIVDALLETAGEDEADDEVVRGFMTRGLSAQATVDAIIAGRAAELVPEVVRDTLAQQASAPNRDSAPVVEALAAATLDAAFRYRVQLAVDFDSVETAAMWAGQASRALHCETVVLDPAGERVRTIVSAAIPATHAPAPKKRDHWSVVGPLLERPGGVGVDEVMRALGWKTPPSLWYFRRWADAAGRGADLVDHGNVRGKRRFSLYRAEARR